MNHRKFSDKDKKHKAGMNFKRSFFNHLSLAVTVFQQYIKLVVYFINELVILSDLGKSHYPPLPCFPVSPLLDLWITSSGKVPSREADDLTPSSDSAYSIVLLGMSLKFSRLHLLFTRRR